MTGRILVLRRRVVSGDPNHIFLRFTDVRLPIYTGINRFGLTVLPCLFVWATTVFIGSFFHLSLCHVQAGDLFREYLSID